MALAQLLALLLDGGPAGALRARVLVGEVAVAACGAGGSSTKSRLGGARQNSTTHVKVIVGQATAGVAACG